MQLPQIDNGLRQLAFRTARQEVPPIDSTSPNRSTDVSRPDDALFNQELGVMDNRHRDVLRSLIRQVTRLRQNHDPMRGTRHLWRVRVLLVKLADPQDGTSVDDIPLIKGKIRR
jgi:hypothetical protein